MRIIFYTFAKKPNSTKRPSDSDTVMSCDCKLKGACSVLAPQLTLQMDLPDYNNPSAINYCYIADFHRYYFINDWTAERGLWVCSASVDVLASHKTGIGNSTLYVTRSSDSSAMNGSISDAVYPTTAIPTRQKQTVSLPWTATNGAYVLGVTSGGLAPPGLTIGTTRYLVCNDTTIQKLAQMLTSDAWFADNPGMFGDIDASTFKAIYNPSQYISSIMWFPYTVPSGTYSSGSLWLGWYKVVEKDSAHGIAFNGLDSRIETYTTTATLPKHPDASTRGRYLNAAPYTEYHLDMQPFGSVSLDASLCAELDSVFIRVTVDHITGLADAYVYSSSAETTLLATAHGQLGVPITLNQISVDHAAEALNARSMRYAQASAAIGIAGDAASLVKSVAGGNWAGAGAAIGDSLATAFATAQALDKGIYNGLKLSAAHMDSAGGTGSWLYINKSWRLDAIFHRPVAEDLEHNGRPVYARKKINTLSGYIEVQDGDCVISCTTAERAQIKAMLEGGCYYE